MPETRLIFHLPSFVAQKNNILCRTKINNDLVVYSSVLQVFINLRWLKIHFKMGLTKRSCEVKLYICEKLNIEFNAINLVTTF